jgi:uncharacterized membrane protein
MAPSPSTDTSSAPTGTPPEQPSAASEPPSTSSESQDDVTRLRAENDRLREQLRLLAMEPARPGPRLHRTRAVGAVVLAVLTSIALVATTVGIWIDRTVWNTDRYVSIVAPIADDPAVTQALAARLTTYVFEALDVPDRVENALASIPNLPPSATFLAGPITASAENVIRQRVETFLASQTFHDLWVQLNRTLHTKIVALLNGDYSQLPNVAVEGGVVQLNLVSAVAEVIRLVVQQGVESLDLNVTIPDIPADLDARAAIDRLASAVGVSLPPDFGQLTIMSQDQLTSYQESARTLDAISGALTIVLVILIGLTLLIANDRRRTLIWLAIGGAAGLLIGGAVIRRVEGRIVDAIQGPGAQAAARDVFAAVSAGLRHAGIIVGVATLLVALIAYLAGRPKWLIAATAAVRRATAQREGGSQLDVWIAAHANAVRIAGVVVAAVVLFVTGIDWVPVAVVGGLLALAMWQVSASQRRVGTDVVTLPGSPTAAEEPETKSEDVTDGKAVASTPVR